MKNIEAGLGASKKTEESSLWKNFKTLGDLLDEDKKLNDQIEKINNIFELIDIVSLTEKEDSEELLWELYNIISFSHCHNNIDRGLLDE